MRSACHAVGVCAVLAIVLGTASPAHAARIPFVFVSGDELVEIRALPADVAEQAGFTHLGYRYQRVGVFMLDLWRWGGEFVVYTGTTYVPVDAALLELLGGAEVPLRYHVPPGLLVIVGLGELALITHRRRKVGVFVVVGGVLAIVTIVFYLKGLDYECVVPGLLAVHHLVGSYSALRRQRAAEAEADVTVAAAEPIAAPELPRSPPPSFETDPFRAPPQPPPLAIQRPDTAPPEARIVHDPDAADPSLLR